MLIAPIAFVSEHVETLVELDHEYARLAEEAGLRALSARAGRRASTPGFIADLARAVLEAAGRPAGAAPHGPWRCPAGHAKCALRRAEDAA